MSEVTAVKLQWCGVLVSVLLLVGAWYVARNRGQYVRIEASHLITFEDGSFKGCSKGAPCNE